MIIFFVTPLFLFILSYIYITTQTNTRKYKIEKLKQDFIKYGWHRYLCYTDNGYWAYKESLHKLIYWHKKYYNNKNYKITNNVYGTKTLKVFNKKEIDMIKDLRRLFCANKDKIHYCWVLKHSFELNNLPPEILIEIEKYL